MTLCGEICKTSAVSSTLRPPFFHAQATKKAQFDDARFSCTSTMSSSVRVLFGPMAGYNYWVPKTFGFRLTKVGGQGILSH
jgi:hypothetical protein